MGLKVKGVSNLPGVYIFYCPGCEMHHQVYVKGEAKGNGPKWGWNGSKEKPTFTPSILVRYPWGEERKECVCHSFVTDGKIRYLNDCTHKLAGEIIELPDRDGDDW